MASEDKVLFVSYVYSERYNLFLIRSIFTSKTAVDLNEIEMDERLEVTPEGYLSGFFDEDELTKFAYDLSDRFKQGKVCLISPECFNKCFEASNKVSDLLGAFIENGQLLENPDHNKKGFFSQFIR